jgi:hypothetical protein
MVPVPIMVYGSDARVVFHLPQGIKSPESWHQYDVDVITPVGPLHVGNSLTFMSILLSRKRTASDGFAVWAPTDDKGATGRSTGGRRFFHA